MDLFREVKKLISPYMRAKGFSLSGKSYYRIMGDMAFCLGFDTPSGMMYATAYVMPLYVPNECKYYTYGNRMNAIRDVKLPVLCKTNDETTIEAWCATLCKCVEEKILPFFEKVATPENLISYLDSHSHSVDDYVFCQDLFIWELKLYTFLYTGDYANANRAIARYRKELRRATFLGGAVRQKLSDKIDEVESMLRMDSAMVAQHCCNTITAVRSLF